MHNQSQKKETKKYLSHPVLVSTAHMDWDDLLSRVISPSSDASLDISLRCAANLKLQVLLEQLFPLFSHAYAEPPRFEKWNKSDFYDYYQPIILTGVCLAAFGKHGQLVAFVSALPLNRSKAHADFAAKSLPSGSWYISDITVHPDYRGRKLGTCLLYVLLAVFSLCGIPCVTARTRVDVPAATCLFMSLGFSIVETIPSCIHNVISNKHLHVMDLAQYSKTLCRFSCRTSSSVVLTCLSQSEASARTMASTIAGSPTTEIIRICSA
jgi:ribosomal protein S18 acetylase RimI-like enzyme